jgi:hypothetical protein
MVETCNMQGDVRNEYKILAEKPEHLGDLGVHRSIILKWILKEQSVRLWTKFIWLQIGSSVGLL